MPAGFGPIGAVLMVVVVVVMIAYMARRVILRRRAARRVERWTREFIDPLRVLAEITQTDDGAVNHDGRCPDR